MQSLLIKRLFVIFFSIEASLLSFASHAAPNPDELFNLKFSKAKKDVDTGKMHALFIITNKSGKSIDDISVSLELVDAASNRVSLITLSDSMLGRVWLEKGKSKDVSFPLDSYPQQTDLIKTKFKTTKLNIKINKINFIVEPDDSTEPVTSNSRPLTVSKEKQLDAKRKAPIVYEPIYKRICQYGHPILVKGWSLDDYTRFVHFKTPEDEIIREKREPYFYIAINNENGLTTQLYYSDIEYYKDNLSYEEDLKKLISIPIISNISSNESDIANVFGEWDYKHNRKNGYKVVYAKPFCLRDKLLFGFYYEVENGSVVKAKGVGSKKGLISDIHDYRVFKGSIESPPFRAGVQHYGDEPQLKDGPIDILLDFILHKEIGDVNEASKLLIYELRDNQKLFSQTEADIEIDSRTLTYQAISRDEGSYKVHVEYSLKNGTRVKRTYEMLFVDSKWRVSQ